MRKHLLYSKLTPTPQTILNCIDNSGATVVECIANLRMKRHGKVGKASKSDCCIAYADDDQGDKIIVVVQKARGLGETLGGAGGAAAQNKVKRGDIRHAVIVRTKKKVQRKDGMVVRFDDNACALIGKNGEPLGTRINGKPPVSALRCGLRQLWGHSVRSNWSCRNRVLILCQGVVGSELRDKNWSKILSLATSHV